jgi:hypothetical protein
MKTTSRAMGSRLARFFLRAIDTPENPAIQGTAALPGR